MAPVLFFIAATGALAGALGVVLLRDPFYSVLGLVCHLVSLAVLFLLLRSEFVAAAQVVVYAGAVMVLYVFVVAYVGEEDAAAPTLAPASSPRATPSARSRHRALVAHPLSAGPIGSGMRLGAALIGSALLAELLIALLGSGLQAVSTDGAPYAPGAHSFGTPAYVGKLLLTRFLPDFEIASFLLLIAAVGALVMAGRFQRSSGQAPELGIQSLAHLDVPRPPETGTMAEGVGGRRA
jgi:NADH:ubiquinone oxidoreductase subunit 6 (subunit J)